MAQTLYSRPDDPLMNAADNRVSLQWSVRTMVSWRGYMVSVVTIEVLTFVEFHALMNDTGDSKSDWELLYSDLLSKCLILRCFRKETKYHYNQTVPS